MNQERLEEWVKQKLDEGIEPGRIKKSLEETDHDPSIVDKVQDPFSSGDDIKERDRENSGPEESPEEPSSEEEAEEVEEQEFSGSGGGEEIGAEENKPDVDLGDNEGFSGFETGEGGSGDGKHIPDISMVPNPSRKSLLGAATVVILIGLVAGIGVFAPGMVNTVTESVTGLTGSLDTSSSGSSSTRNSGNSGIQPVDNGVTGQCPEKTGVVLESVDTAGGSTTASVVITQGSLEVVFNVYDDDRLVGSTSKSFSGESTITVDAIGNKAVAHPAGCRAIIDSQEY